MKSLFTILALTLSISAFGEPVAAPMDAPKGLIVRQDMFGNDMVYKMDLDSVRDEASAKNAIATFVKPENQIQGARPLAELDQSTSTQAWYYWYAPQYGYNYYYYYSYSYSYSYQPYYGWYNNHHNCWYWYYRW